MKRKDSIFTHVPVKNVKRNMFDLSHEVKMSGKFGYLYPMLLIDTLPGDSFREKLTVFLRAAPMLAPIMHRVDVTSHFFFVPNRLLSSVWEEAITAGQDGEQAPILPYWTASVLAGGYPEVGTLADYLGLPVTQGGIINSQEQISVLPFRAYWKVWNDYYRDPNFDAEIPFDIDAQGDVSGEVESYNEVKRHMWQKDLYTAALPWAQRGVEVLLPITGQIDTLRSAVTGNLAPTGKGLTTDTLLAGQLAFSDAAWPIANQERAYLEFDGSTTSVNEVRRTFAIQQWMEANARGGYRYVEQIESHFNVRVPDYRLQRAEYLGGNKQPITISEVLSTADTDDVPVGDMAGHGISVGKSNRIAYKCQEHGWILGIVTVTPQTAYSQGLEKMWTRKDKFDFAWPELAHIGEQELLSKEIFFSWNNADADDNQELFGYVPRYSEYKFKQDRIAGDFRTTLKFWHLGRMFTARPVLDQVFTTMYEDGVLSNEESYRRIFAVQDGTDYLWMQIFHRVSALRPLPYFGVPKQIV